MRLSIGLGVAAIWLGGCLSDVIPYHQKSTGGDLPDMAEAVGDSPDLAQGSAPPDLAGATPDLTDCVALTQAINDGHHNPGQVCLNCHNGNTAGAPQFYLAGTLFAAATGTAPLAGATIEFKDGAGQLVQLISSINGNFYTEQPVTYPITTVKATGCPNTQLMPDAVQLSGASCNSCHDGTTQPQIHLP